MNQVTPESDVELRHVDGGLEATAAVDVPDGEVHEYTAGEADGQSLPPYDRGKAAWTLLLAAFVFEALLWG